MRLDHVAILTPSIEASLAVLGDIQAEIGEIEDFPAEGTRELYIGAPDQAGRILLLQSTDPQGPYGRAMSKRGPGLHHLALRVADLDAFIASMQGWLLHPISLKSHAESSTIWLARPGIPMLLEVFENPTPLQHPPLVTAVHAPTPPELISHVVPFDVAIGEHSIALGETRVLIRDLT